MAEVKGIREYNRIRRFIEHIYLYGFFSREDFEKAGIGSAKDYDYVTALVRSIFPDIYETALWQGRKKHVRFVRHYERNGENRLADSYLLRSVNVDAELPKQLHILAALCGGPKTVDALSAIVELQCQGAAENSEAATASTSPSSHRRRVDRLAEAEYIRKQKKEFALVPNPFQRLTDAELAEIYDYICFASGASYPRVAGSYLRRSTAREFYRSGLPASDGDAVLLRHNAKRCVFDEDILYELREYMRPKPLRKNELPYYKSVCITVRGSVLDVLPAALRADTRLGRWYLLAHDGQKPLMCRLSDITDIKPGKFRLTEEQRKTAMEPVYETFTSAGCSGALPDEDSPVLVEALLRFDDAPELYQQFQREMRLGSVQEQDGKLFYRAYVNDPVELMPFLRAYSPWLTILPGAHDLDRRLAADLRQMYEALNDTEDAAYEAVP